MDKIIKNKYIKFRVDNGEHHQLLTESLQLKISLSEFIRYKLGFPLKRDYQMFLFHISKIGNNLNQLAKAMNIARKLNNIDSAKFNVVTTRLLCIQAELENLRIDFKAGELNDNKS